MALNPPDRGVALGDNAPKAGSPDDLNSVFNYVSNAAAERAQKNATVRKRRTNVHFTNNIRKTGAHLSTETVRTPDSTGHHYIYDVDPETKFVLPMTAIHADDCPTCQGGDSEGKWK
jgi:hypothetical protein